MTAAVVIDAIRTSRRCAHRRATTSVGRGTLRRNVERPPLRHPGRAVRRRSRPACTACSTRPRSASRRSPRSTAARRSASTTCATSSTAELDGARALALFTIGETPWSDAQRATILERRARRAACRSSRSTPRPTPATAGTTTGSSWAPASTVIRGRRRSSPTCSTRRIPRARTSAPSGVARRGVPVPRSPPRRAGAAARARRRARPQPRRARGRRRSATRSRGASPKARAACSRRASGTSRRVGDARVPAPPLRRPRLGARPKHERVRGMSRAAATSPTGRTGGCSTKRRSTPTRARSTTSRPSSSRGGRACASGCSRCSGPRPSRCRSTSRSTETVDCGSYRRERIVFDTSRRCRCPRTCSCRTTRTEPGPGDARDPRARSGQVAHLRRARPATTRTTKARRTRTCSRSRATSCSRPTCAASASAPTGCPTTSTTATGISCARRWPASCRTSATSGTCSAALDVLAAHPLVDPQRMGAAGLLVRRDVHAVPRRDRRTGARRGRRVLPVVVARRAPDAVEHVRLADRARPDRRSSSTSTSRR